MRVFVTGAAGFIGSVTVTELLNHGHQVIGLARSDASAEKITKLGAEVQRGDLTDLESLKSGAKKADAIIHLAFGHDFDDFAKFPEHCANDRAAITAMAEAIEGTKKPLIAASGTLNLPKGQIANEDMESEANSALAERSKSEHLLKSFSKERGIHTATMRLSPVVHGKGDWAFIHMFGEAARKNGAVYYVGDGSPRWPAVHRTDAAVVLRLAVEKAAPQATYHAVAEEGVAVKDIMNAIGKKLDLPVKSASKEEATQYLGFFASLLSVDNTTSSAKTQKELGWKPANLGLLADIEANYF